MFKANDAKAERCRQLFARLTANLEIEPNSDSAQELQDYLKDCEPCTEFIESLESTLALCQQYREQSLTNSLSPELLARFQSSFRRSEPLPDASGLLKHDE